MRAVVGALVLLLTTPTFAGAAGGPDVKAIRALLQRQMTLVKQGEYRAMYRTTTTRSFRARCPYAKFVRTQRELRRRLGPTGVVDRIRVRFQSAKRAVVAYRFLKNRRPLVWVSFSDRDLHAKVGSRWFDDYDRLAC